MTIALVGTPQVAFASGSGTALSTPAVSHTAENLLVVTVSWEATAAVASVSDSAGDDFWVAGPRYAHAGGAMFTQVFYCEATRGSSSNIITFTLSAAATFRAVTVSQWSHTARVQLDGEGQAQVTGGTTVTVTPNPTTAESTLVCVGVSTFAPSAVTNSVGGYTDGPDPANELTQWYKVVTAAGGITSTFTFGADNVQAVFAVFRENSSPGAPNGQKAIQSEPHVALADAPLETRALLNVLGWV